MIPSKPFQIQAIRRWLRFRQKKFNKYKQYTEVALIDSMIDSWEDLVDSTLTLHENYQCILDQFNIGYPESEHNRKRSEELEQEIEDFVSEEGSHEEPRDINIKIIPVNHSNYSGHGKKKTTIELSMETRDKLRKLGKKGDTYEDIILRLLSGSQCL